MQTLTPDGERAVQNLAQRYGVSVDAVKTLLFAVSAGGGTMAQFHHPELGGGGQWMRGGMTMVGDMFNSGLQATVSGLCAELSSLLANGQPIAAVEHSSGGFRASGNAWWPAELGVPSSSGAQNDSRYAYFPQLRRLAVERGGQMTVYDTLDHRIGGVQQQQGGTAGSLSFSSQFGTFTVDSLRALPTSLPEPAEPAPLAYQPSDAQNSAGRSSEANQAPSHAPESAQALGSESRAEILTTIERLAQLHQKGILSDDEFRSKKSELLARL
jgi:hypothetical protein